MTNLLLTGAGFTKNFGGLLASEMWYKIYNAIDSKENPELKSKIKQFRKEYDFEGFYSEIENGEYDESTKELTRAITYKAYLSLDNIVQEWRGSSSFPISELLLSNFLSQFNYFFTTNQDLFVERKILNNQFFSPLVKDNTTYRDMLRSGNDMDGLKIRLPMECSKEDLDNVIQHNTGSYVKLHGSFNWVCSDNSKVAMVIGSLKDTQIEKEPLLRQYLKLFEQQLKLDDVQMVTIGYGFKDEHINKKIKDSLKNHNLKLFVISPLDMDSWGSQIDQEIVNNIEGYFKYSLLDIFPLNGNGTEIREELKRALKLGAYVIR